jgi:hypothetical protein
MMDDLTRAAYREQATELLGACIAFGNGNYPYSNPLSMMPGEMSLNNRLRSLVCVALEVPLSRSKGEWPTREAVIAGTRATLIAAPEVFGPRVIPEVRADEAACEELLDRLIARMNRMDWVIRERERTLRRWKKFLEGEVLETMRKEHQSKAKANRK